MVLARTTEVKCMVMYLFTNIFGLAVHTYLFRNVFSFFSSFFSLQLLDSFKNNPNQIYFFETLTTSKF